MVRMLVRRAPQPGFPVHPDIVSTLLVSHRLHAARGAELTAYCAREGIPLDTLVLPAAPDARLPEAECARIESAFFSVDVFPDYSRQFFSTVRKAPKLGWMQLFNAGVDHPIYAEMLARGVRLTTASGAASVPIAQTAIMGLLMLARNVPRWLAAQREHRWAPLRGADVPRDLAGQTIVVLGLGRIGSEIARLAKALGLTVVGVRRGPRRAEDPVHEVCTPAQLPAALARADWLAIACPLNAETRGLMDATMLAQLPRGARLINIARGEVVDEAALVAALQSGHLGGAYLDVFAQEPLPADSPLWDLPNVFVTPHNAGAASGNDDRVFGLLLENLRRRHRGEALVNEVKTI